MSAKTFNNFIHVGINKKIAQNGQFFADSVTDHDESEDPGKIQIFLLRDQLFNLNLFFFGFPVKPFLVINDKCLIACNAMTNELAVIESTLMDPDFQTNAMLTIYDLQHSKAKSAVSLDWIPNAMSSRLDHKQNTPLQLWTQ